MSSHRPHAPLFIDQRTQMLPPAHAGRKIARTPLRKRIRAALLRLFGRPVLPS